MTRRFPRWSGPLLGAIIVPLFVLRRNRNHTIDSAFGDNYLLFLIGSSVAGALIGGLVMLLDTSSSKAVLDQEIDLLPADAPSKPQSSIISKFLAITSILLAITGVIGLALGAAGVLSSLRSKGWPYVTSWFGVVLSLPVSVVEILVWTKPLLS